jgi:phosphoglycolate phosphatase
MWDTLTVNSTILEKLKLSNLALSDLATASAALNNLYFDAERHFVVISTPPCDPNLLGFISDLSMQVDSVDYAVAYSEGSEGLKFSVRTAAREVKASELAEWLSKDIGSGGGHRKKAGGYISKAQYERRFGDLPPRSYFTINLKNYLEAFRIIDYGSPATLTVGGVNKELNEALNEGSMKTYRKLPVCLGFVPCHKLFEGRADLQIRMLEGDVDIVTDEETVLMIGVKGEVYPMELGKFIETYNLTGERFAPTVPYPPTVLNKNTGMRLSLLEFADTCVGTGEGTVRAVRLEERVKIFTRWDVENYLRGEPGDWLVARAPDDLYVVMADVFDELYSLDVSLDVEGSEGGFSVGGI